MEEDVEAINGLKHLLDFCWPELIFCGDPYYGKSGAGKLPRETCKGCRCK
jgi:hypothetical protein